MNAWAKAVADYAASFAECRRPLTEAQLRKVSDAFQALQREHYHALKLLLDMEQMRKAHEPVLARSLARLERGRRAGR